MNDIRYYSLNNYFKTMYGERVHRIPVDAGFSCPNRDGTKSKYGCIYCDEIGSGAKFIKRNEVLKKQVESGIDSIRKRFKVSKYLVYFQSFTNTYAPVDKLRELYYSVLDIKNVVGIAIGTRPDCINKEKIELIEEIAKEKMVWIEYGLQSANDKTLVSINRHHTFKDFKDAVILTKNKGINILAHIILGLPGEDKKDMLKTAQSVAELKLDGIKIHSLYIVKGTALEKMYNNSEFTMLTREEYIKITADILEILPPDMVIHRLVGECDRERLAAPEWILDKNKILSEINNELERRGSVQGSKYSK